MCDVRVPPIVIDHGTHTSKAGFAGDDFPRAVFPSIVGVPKKMENVIGWRMKDTYVGDEAKPSRDILNPPLPPLQSGIIANWDSMEKIWFHTFFNELRVAPENHPVLLTEVPFNPKYNRQRMAEIMFETFKCPSLYVCTSAVLSLYATGRTTGIVLDSGHEVTHAVPVYEGYALPASTTKLCYGGSHLTKYLRQLIDKRPGLTHTFIDERSMEELKEKTCFVADDFEDCLKTSYSDDTRFELPDGKEISLGNESFICPEALFKPKRVDLETSGIHEAIYKSIMMSDDNIRKHLFANIVLSGGNSMFKGLQSRTEREIRNNMDHIQINEINVVCGKHRDFQAWIGGSIFASVTFPSNLWISKDDYSDVGRSIVDFKCF